MPSQRHEALLLLFRNHPELAAELLREALRVELPEYSHARIESADLSQTAPTEYRADLVVLLGHQDKPVLGIVVEAQLRRSTDKRFAWPAYVMTLRSRCPCCLLVITADRGTARWASQPIITGPGGALTPLVIGPDGVPVVDPERAERSPELAVLSVIAHGREDVETAVKIALGAIRASAQRDEDTRVLYYDLIEAALGHAARKAFAMLPESYKFRGPTFKQGERKGKVEGKREGLAEGKLEGQIEALFDVLDARAIPLTPATRARLQGATDIDQVRQWLRRAAVVQNAEALFDE